MEWISEVWAHPVGALAIAVVLAFVSCWISRLAGGDDRGLWGLLGPAGWIVAAVHHQTESVAYGLDELRSVIRESSGRT